MSVYAVPQIPTPPDTDDITALREYVQQLANVTAMAMKELDWLLNGNMDVKNIRANAIEAKLIKAGAVTAEKISVDELSAISADLGTITAGTITSNTSINVGTDANIGNLLNLNASSSSGARGVVFHNPVGGSSRISVLSGDMGISSPGMVTINGGAGIYAGGAFNANGGISVGVSLMGGDGTPVYLEFTRGMISDVS